ncbi:hypothetical protein LUZ60_006280 [Juncus effusus]|nr:hypothetical protein LUZ60_006280 [Juncus effusus]
MGRDSASQLTHGAIALALIFFVIQLETSKAETYIVGERRGWTFNSQDWPNGKTFNAGDTLVFSYNPSYHNVVQVDLDGYNSCTASSSSFTNEYSTGKDGIALGTGTSYFICSRYDHCALGMKIAVNAM